MPVRPLLVLALLPLFAGCQLFSDKAVEEAGPQMRVQGQLSRVAGQWLLRPCQEKQRLVINDSGATGISREAAELLSQGPGPLFADVRGRLHELPNGAVGGQLRLDRVYRLQREGAGCDDPQFKRVSLVAQGQEPSWRVVVSNRGLMLERPGQAPLALPYLEEQLPEGRLNLTSEANGRRLELWAAPQHCVDAMSGALHHLSTELRLDGQVLRGCGYYGGARSD